MAASRKRNSSSSRDKVGVWLFGGLGGLATTVVVGARSIARGLSEPRGLITAAEDLQGLQLCEFPQLVFGGHEVRASNAREAAAEIDADSGSLRGTDLRKLGRDLDAYDRELRPGCLINAGRTIRRVAGTQTGRPPEAAPLREQIARLCADIEDFKRRHKLRTVICVNLTSTEPILKLTRTHADLARFEEALDKDRKSAVRPSSLYAYAAASLGLPFIHFTPSNATLIPAIRQLFENNGAPYMGSDGKSGETLVKSALAPMFRIRDLRVLSWQGYNMLGDRDGAVLADADNKQAKVESKDRLLQSILGYPLHSQVAIDFVPSLGDAKTAWDFIHFEGFLGHRMSMQFVWQGCDAILAAPLVLDMVRLTELAARRGHRGSMPWLGVFFKSPLDSDQHDLHAQWLALAAWLADAAD